MTINKDKTLEQSINGVWFRNTTLWALRSPQTIAAIPGFIYRTHAGDYSDLTFAAALPVITFDSISTGIYVSVNCHDQVFAIPTEGLDETIYDLCTLWGVTSPIPGENDPINSDIPTLIFAGKYDSVTPPSFAHQLAAHLSRSYLAEIPNQGHAPSTSGTSDCSGKVILSFVGNPNGVPDVGCVNESSKIKFVVPFDGSTPLSLEPVTVSDYQIRTVIPTGWTDAGFGFYNRNGKIVDIAQIGVQSAAVPEAQWVSWLATNFQGTQGLDSPALQYDQHNANGLAWTIYRTSSRGNPIDIAFTKSGSQTLMVLLFSYQDEHDALYNTLFLPVIDSTKSSR
jgi:Predicted hydrolases or acyltransferases (alpha/beta hydrolase superfamily)